MMRTEEQKAHYIAYNREWRKKNPEKVALWHKKYRDKNKEKLYELTKKWRLQNKEKMREYNKKWRDGTGRDYRRKIRLEVLEHYGGLCVCCGETQIEFLSLDHKDNNGNAHRREVGRRNIAEWARQHAYPDFLQVLCHNCNLAKGFYGNCPHKGVVA